MPVSEDTLKLGPHEFRSRLLVGTGKYQTLEQMQLCLAASGCEVVTVALRRVNLDDPDENILNFIDAEKYTILPNTAGCYSAEDAIKVCLLARELGIADLVKLEVIGDEKTLLPDVHATLEATRILVKEGFTVLAYTTDDVVTAKKLEDAGAASVMPLGSPIGSGQGILNRLNIELIMEAVEVPVIVDAGVGTASDVSVALEMGVDGVLLNTGIAGAKDPVRMAHAMRMACEAGRLAYLAGRIPRKRYATASTPAKDF
jgi:thiazole synthase